MSYVYQYLDYITKEPFYIGKGSGPRDKFHLKEAAYILAGKPILGRRSFFMNVLLKKLRNNQPPSIERIKDNLTHDEAYALEESIIAKYGRIGIDVGGILTNRDRGGLGGRDYKMSHKRIEALIKRNKASKGKKKPGLSAYIAANPDKHWSRLQKGTKHTEAHKVNNREAQLKLKVGKKIFTFMSPTGSIHRVEDWKSFLKEQHLGYNLIRAKGQPILNGISAGWTVVSSEFPNRVVKSAPCYPLGTLQYSSLQCSTEVVLESLRTLQMNDVVQHAAFGTESGAQSIR
jgi:hypothetical protein